MASTTSVISLFICLLATYCYSVPVGREYDISTSRNEFSTGKSMTEHDSMAMVTPSEQTTVHSMMHHRGMGDGHEMYDATTVFPVEQTTVYPKRGLVEDSFTTLANEFTSEVMPKRDNKDDESDEATTERQFSKDGQYQTRGLVEDSFTTMANEFTSEAMPKRDNKDSESDEVTTERQSMTTAGHGKRGDADDVTFTTTEFTATSDRPHHARAFEHDSFTTMESSTQFNGHATRNEEDKHEGHFSGMDMSTIESTSSIDSFGKVTGLLQNEQTEQKPMTTKFESENRVVKTETIIPGKITETKIYSGIPSRTLIVDEPMTTESSRLSQGETMFHNAEIKSNH